ncbi:MAG: hypothetical protein AAFV62_12505, partial [Pseudomonadota bacterium]
GSEKDERLARICGKSHQRGGLSGADIGAGAINRGDYQSGWDTDQFAMNVPEFTLALYEVLKAGGFTTGGLNFDAKLRRQSIDPDDILHAHAASMDAIARALLNASALLETEALSTPLAERYAGWGTAEGRAILAGERSLDDLAARVHRDTLEPAPRSGRQEYLEGIVNRHQR